MDDRGRLHLALRRTDTPNVRWTALPFETLREELLDSPAAIRVLVPDCCSSGRAIEAMTGGHSTVAGQVDVAGTYTLASTSANAVAYAPQGTKHTAFTGALLTALRGPVALNLNDLFEEVRRDLAAHGMPRPQRRVINNAGDLVLVRQPDPLDPAIAPPPAKSTNPDRSAPGPAPVIEPSPAESIDPGAFAPARPSWLTDNAVTLPEPRGPEADTRGVWIGLAFVTAALILLGFWIYGR
ncbi:caspase family protein [Streptomyces noursei]|uniref:caspase family protein n=1 Tax=Streptomyces noursei TaxID=1971 RepID=UPI001678EDE7|nr:caspase family protein [Streptomyces noursei]MCZ1013095.1 caspase family protein [Streptomyces noursei]